jgi:hypothetical protein
MKGRSYLMAAAVAGLATVYSLAAWAAPFARDGLVVTHASRHYHTAPETIAATQAIVREAAQAGRTVVALGQWDIATDPDWYAPFGGEITRALLSHHGENDLQPDVDAAGTVRFAAIGGYHGACLGWTLAELVSRALLRPATRLVEVTLPMAAIYTGFRRGAAGELVPATPEDEANADDSIDGLNMRALTAGMTDAEWVPFMAESVRVGFFETAPMVALGLRDVAFELWRNGRRVHTMAAPWVTRLQGGRVVRLRYVDRE